MFKPTKFHYVLIYILIIDSSLTQSFSYREAFEIACLGVTDSDWKVLAFSALDALDLDVARKAFIRTKDLVYLDLIHEMQVFKSNNKDLNEFKLKQI